MAIMMLPAMVFAADEDIITGAMGTEIQRAMEGLVIEDMLPPSYISYTVSDARTLHVKASLGAIVSSMYLPLRFFDNRVLVGSGGKTNENFIDERNMWSYSGYLNYLPLSGGADDIRRAMWLPTDSGYKDAITAYKSKMSAIRQQNIPAEEKEVPDFSFMPKSEIVVPYKNISIDRDYLETLAREISEVFKDFPAIQKSEVNVFVYDGQVFFANSEGTTAQYPFQVAGILASASTQTESGERISDNVFWCSKEPGKLPEAEMMIAGTRVAAEKLTELSVTAPVEEPYWGPVMFEGQAAAEAFVQKFFSEHDGLIAVRKPLFGSPWIAERMPDSAKENGLEARLGKRIMSRDISIEALPGLTEFGGTELIGSFTVDAEGVTPPEHLMLVENGVLKNLLNDRVPTQKIRDSNGHGRPALSQGGIKTVTAPGVVKISGVTDEKTLDDDAMKQALIAEAKEQDLEYAYILRKIALKGRGSSSRQKDDEAMKTIEAYRVYVSDGREERVGLAEISGLSVRSFNRIIASSERMQVYNTMLQPVSARLSGWGFGLTGTPASFIVPQSFILQELDIIKEKQDVIENHPIVGNPVGARQ